MAVLVSNQAQNTGATAPSDGNWWQYGAVYAVYAVVMISLGESEQWGDVVAALAWLVFLAALTRLYNPFRSEIDMLTGVKL